MKQTKQYSFNLLECSVRTSDVRLKMYTEPIPLDAEMKILGMILDQELQLKQKREFPLQFKLSTITNSGSKAVVMLQ